MQRLQIPSQAAGQFYPRGDADWFKFEAKKGQTIAIEAICQRHGLPADPQLLVQRVKVDDKGVGQTATNLQEVDDSAAPGQARPVPMPPATTRSTVCPFQKTARTPCRTHLVISIGAATRVLLTAWAFAKRRPIFVVAVAHFPLGWPAQTIPGRCRARQAGVAFQVIAFRRDNFNGEISSQRGGTARGRLLRRSDAWARPAYIDAAAVGRRRRGRLGR